MSHRRMFIDDLRTPSDFDMQENDYVIVRSSGEAIEWIKQNGIPSFISFDHDLDGDDTAMKIVDFIVEQILDEKMTLEPHFGFKVHSANPIGSINIESKMNNLIKFIRGEN